MGSDGHTLVLGVALRASQVAQASPPSEQYYFDIFGAKNGTEIKADSCIFLLVSFLVLVVIIKHPVFGVCKISDNAKSLESRSIQKLKLKY